MKIINNKTIINIESDQQYLLGAIIFDKVFFFQY